LTGSPPRIEAAAASNDADEQARAYRVVSVQRSSAPGGSSESDWHVYSIAQGPNMIQGYRRGDLASVTAEAEKIVSGLNERRNFQRRTPSRPGRRPANAAPSGDAK
jgi:acetamidase/formamidase